MRGRSLMRGRSPMQEMQGVKTLKSVNAGSKPDAGNTGLKPNARPKPNAAKPDARPKPNAGNAGLKPDAVNAEPKPDDVNTGPELDRKVQEMQKQKSMLRNSTGRYKAVALICLRSLWREGRVKTAGGLPAVVGTTRLSCGVGDRDGLGLWSQRILLWRSEDRGWSTCEGWHDSPVLRGMPEPTKYVSGGVPKLYGPECKLLSGPASRDFGSRGLGVSTFPWGRVTDTRKKESPLIILEPEGRGRISYSGLGIWNT
ncbi:hypothetical protein CRG98_006740 [Punica granatum]|uniref:Uncharacterized protein n=1 Tax=Punica granatum TaxID=22663 RepID=A0A2I0KWM4_PUNGR|nr:hypothetical protein CRG98_006740 [Punica granatum]